MEPNLHPVAGRIAARARAPSNEDADRAEYARIVTENEAALFRHIYKRLDDYHLTCDILQDTFRAAWEKRHTRNSQLPPLPWLKTIARHKISDHFTAANAQIRGGGKSQVVVVTLDPSGDPQPESASALYIAPDLESWQEASKNELMRALRLLTEQLPYRDQEILRMHYTERIPVTEIAAFFDLSEPAMTSILHRLRKTLKEQLRTMGFSNPSSDVNRHVKGDIM